MLFDWDGTHPGLNLGAKLLISFKCSFKANILLEIIQDIFALDLHLEEIHSFAPRFNPGWVPTQSPGTLIGFD